MINKKVVNNLLSLKQLEAGVASRKCGRELISVEMEKHSGEKDPADKLRQCSSRDSLKTVISLYHN